jgi:hypothetical protein
LVHWFITPDFGVESSQSLDRIFSLWNEDDCTVTDFYEQVVTGVKTKLVTNFLGNRNVIITIQSCLEDHAGRLSRGTDEMPSCPVQLYFMAVAEVAKSL